MCYFRGGIGHLGMGLSPLVENFDETAEEDQNDEEDDLQFLLSANFEKELDEKDEYEVEQRSNEDEDLEEDEDNSSDTEEGGEDDQEEDIDYNDNGYDEY
ncbi:hypothetical protein F5146DRAFT_1147308 [Armillaria mellea]|nr:hypothetical protein F5146DRAFT_1147308 [Armillaria mellea]